MLETICQKILERAKIAGRKKLMYWELKGRQPL